MGTLSPCWRFDCVGVASFIDSFRWLALLCGRSTIGRQWCCEFVGMDKLRYTLQTLNKPGAGTREKISIYIIYIFLFDSVDAVPMGALIDGVSRPAIFRVFSEDQILRIGADDSLIGNLWIALASSIAGEDVDGV